MMQLQGVRHCSINVTVAGAVHGMYVLGIQLADAINICT
jgi:hypothetical protein